MMEQGSQQDVSLLEQEAPNERRPIIAIDGPAGSGKSTTARMVSKRLGFTYLDTGAFYRALTLKVLEANVPPENHEAVLRHAEQMCLSIKPDAAGDRFYLDGQEVTAKIRAPHVTNAIAPISANPRVRAIMVKRQREIGNRGGVVMEGRDIGTVVFPNADLKIFMSASLDERTRRRQDELALQGIRKEFETLRREIEMRDEKDAKRDVAPLRPATDAILLDTTSLTIEQQVDFIVQALRKKMQAV
ncbi:MAG: (d)CMP kinase [bacterium]